MMKVVAYLLPFLIVAVVGEWLRKTKQNVATNDIINRFKQLSITACFSRCKTHPKCVLFAMNKDIRMGQTAECVLLSNHEKQKYIGVQNDNDVVELFVYEKGPVCKATSPCKEYEICEDTFRINLTYKCACRQGYRGDKCEIYEGCNEPCCLVLISEQTQIKENTLLATVTKLEKEYSLHLEYMITELSAVNNGFYNIFHATTGGQKDVYGSRAPAIYIFIKDGYSELLIRSAINGDNNYPYNGQKTPIEFNKTVKVDVSQTKVGDKYVFKVEKDGDVIFIVNNEEPREFHNMKIYISNPWLKTFSGYVGNVYLKGACGIN